MAQALRVMIVEDEARLASSIRQGLSEEGFDVAWAPSAEAADERLASGDNFDVIVLDLGLPGVGGLDWLRRNRDHTQAAVLILTARGAVEDRVSGLDAGADDYLAKPFAFAELVARIRAISRRPRTGAQAGTLAVGELEFDAARRRFRLGAQPISLSPKETMLLELLMRHANDTVTRDMITRTVWDSDLTSYTNLIEVFVNRLRKKLEPARNLKIVTARGVGYSLQSTQ
jgi:DNA-binding response OmpR family regulator